MINLSEKFKRDISGQATVLTPLIVIDDRIYLSNTKINFGGQTYNALLDNLGSLNQSFDINIKNSQISNTTISFFNEDYGVNLSEVFFTPSILNTELKLYIKSQSCESLSDCLNIMNGKVVSIEENNTTIKIEVEDTTEEVLGQEIPFIYTGDSQDIPDRYKNKEIPIVYGIVKKSPCVYKGVYKYQRFGSDKFSITPDRFFLSNVSNPYVFADNEYMSINENLRISSLLENTIYSDPEKTQYRILQYSNEILIDKTVIMQEAEDSVEIEKLQGSLPAFNLVEVTHISDVSFDSSTHILRTMKTGESSVFNTFPLDSYENEKWDAATKSQAPFIIRISSNTDINTGETSLMNPFNDSISGTWYPILWGVGTENLNEDFSYFSAHGDTVLQFVASPTCNESRILMEAENKDRTGTVPVKGSANPIHSMYAKVKHINELFPKIFFHYDEKSTEFWRIGQQSGIQQISDEFIRVPLDGYHTEGYETLAGGITNVDVTINKFTLQNRKRNSSGSGLIQDAASKGLIHYIGFNSLQFERKFIMRDFMSYDIYADVIGRVDTVDGKYTGTKQLNEAFIRMADSGEQAQEEQIQAQPVRRPIRQIVSPPKKPSKIVKKQVKSMSGKKNKQGGY